MNINALLSPEDGVGASEGASANAVAAAVSAAAAAAGSGGGGIKARATTAAASSAPPRGIGIGTGMRPVGGKRTSSGLSQQLSHSPERPTVSPVPPGDAASHRPVVLGAQQHQHQQQQQQQQQLFAPPVQAAPPIRRSFPSTSNPVRSSDQHNVYGYAQRPAAAPRPLSNPQMETLTDLTGATSSQHRQQQQQHQQQQQPPPRAYSHDHLGTQTQARPKLQSHQSSSASPPVARTISRQSLADLTMAEAPAQTPPPRDFVSNALSDEESQRVSELLAYLRENSYAYQHHVELINLLHKGFLAHVGATEAMQPGEPSTYALLKEMRQAREAMDSRFAVGEAIWMDWLNDEIIAAKSTEERIAVLELCQKAVADEPASVKLWQAYADYVSDSYVVCHASQDSSDQDWIAECKELFTLDLTLSVLEQAAAATQWRIDESHTMWNRFAKVVYDQLSQHPSPAEVGRIHNLFLSRLKTPQAHWADTMQLYWPIISRFEGENWEAAIAHINQQAEPAKACYSLREDHEVKLRRAIESHDSAAVHHQVERYLKDERFYALKPRMASPFDYELRCALYERAVLLEPTNLEWWLDYVDFLMTDPKSTSLLSVIERATRHCPWSGELWARRILRADVEQLSRDDIGNIKHRATNAGLLDVGGLEEYVKMLQEWCSYLRRYAFRETSTEDDIDTAEFGMHSALEDVQEAGKRVYGADFQGDPLFRLEQIQIKFFAEVKRMDQARDIFKSLSTRLGGSFDFWNSYYTFEIWLWGWERMREERRVERPDNTPVLAHQVVQEALQQRNLDFPERVLQLYTSHFQQHGSGVALQHALADAREFSKKLAAQRAKQQEEAEAAAAQQQQQEQLAAASQALDSIAVSGEKRKREDEHEHVDSSKKAKTLLEPVAEEHHVDSSATADALKKRDRENNSITLRNLPLSVKDVDIKKFFNGCGNPVSINTIQDKGGETVSAIVEFETEEDVKAAKTRSGKELGGREVNIQSGTGSTLYVTNYPAEYDDGLIRRLFESYGEIVMVRMPSLKYNSRRRFCYVQFLTPDMANAAEAAMDGKKLDGRHTLLAKIANPDAKKPRTGALSEGREIMVRQSDREASEQQIRQFFESYGDIERMNIVRLVNNKPTGTVFITYATAEQATAAVEGTNLKPFRDRILQVQIVSPKGRGAAPHERAGREDFVVKQEKPSATPEPAENGVRRGSDVSMQSVPRDEASYEAIKARKIAIFNIDETVNDARIKTAMEQYGPITKIQLRRERRGAIIEFKDVKDAFRVRMGVDVRSLGSEASTGDVADLLAKQHQKRTGDGSRPAAFKPAFAPPQATRPGAGRGGRRGGLGFKRGGFPPSSARGNVAGPGGDSGAETSKKSNNDFRSMLEASKTKKDETNGDMED